MSFRTIPNDRLIDGDKIDNLPTDVNAELALKVDKTTTVNTKALSGNVALTTDDIPEGAAEYDKVVSILAGAGISVTGTYPNFTVTNSSPDEVVTLTAGANVTITGTYPSFTIASTGGGGGGTWGSITGTLSDQTDLQSALDAKVPTTRTVNGHALSADVTVTKGDVGLGNADNTSDLNKPVSTATQTALDGKVDKNAGITGATKTKITYDSKGLVTSGADATTADIADSTNKRYVTDAQLTVIGNTSGVNTGDQTITLTGDVTGSGTGSFVTTIAGGAVTNAKLANMSSGTFKGRTSAGIGSPEDLTATQATALLNAMVGDSGSGGTKGLVPAPASGDASSGKYLKADGTWSIPPGGGGTGDVTGPSSSVDSEIALFSSTTGKVIKRATTTGIVKATSGVISAAVADTDYTAPATFNSHTSATAAHGATWAVVGTTNTQTLTNKTLTTPVLNGTPTGTGVATAATASTLALRDANGNLAMNNWVGGYTTTATAAGTTTLTVSSTFQQFFTGTTTQTVVLPVTTTLAVGHEFQITNLSTGLVTVNSSGGNAVIVLASGTSAFITCITASGTTAASWKAIYLDNAVASGKAFTVSNSLTLAGTDGKGINVGAATSGKVLVGDGTNMVLSTPTLPVSSSATSRKIMVSDGTNWVASTETFATPWTAGNVLTSDGTNWTSAAPSSSGGGTWTTVSGTRASNTTFTVSGDVTATFSRGLVIKWAESSAVKCGMVVSSSYSAPNTTVTIIGDTMASIDSSSLKYTAIPSGSARFAVAGSIGATWTNVANAFYATEAYRVIGADLQVGTAGTTNSTTIDLNKAGTTMFTTKPTLASTVAYSSSPFTADSGTSLAIGDNVTMDVDAIQTTAAVDLYAQLYLFPTRILNMS